MSDIKEEKVNENRINEREFITGMPKSGCSWKKLSTK